MIHRLRDTEVENQDILLYKKYLGSWKLSHFSICNVHIISGMLTRPEPHEAEAEATTHEAEAEATTHEAEATTHEAEATTHEAEAEAKTHLEILIII